MGNSLLPAISPKGEPLGNPAAGKVIKPPNGVPHEEWIELIELAATHFRRTAGAGKPEREILKAYDVSEAVSKKTWKLVFDYPHNLEDFEKALAVRGVLPLGVGLTAQQSLALDIMSDPSLGSFATRCRKAGIRPAQWQQWLLDPNFADQFNTLVGRRMNANKGLIDTVITAQALEGSLEAIKYYDKRVGRDPDKKHEMDGQKVVNILVDVLTKVLSDQPELMRQIFAELEVKLKFSEGE